MCLAAQLCPTLCDPVDYSLPDSSVHGDSPGKNTEVGCHALLQGICPTQGSNQGFSPCRRILYQLSHQGNPRILEWVVYPFSRGSSQPRNQTRVCCIAGRFFTSWVTREAPNGAISNPKWWCCYSAALKMLANLLSSAVATGLEKVSFHPNPKEGQCTRMFKHTIAYAKECSNT